MLLLIKSGPLTPFCDGGSFIRSEKRGSKELCGVVMAIEIADPLWNVPGMYRELKT